MDDVVIRASRADDLPTVADLRWRWSVDEDGGTPTATAETFRRSMTDFALAHPETHRCVVAEQDGVVVGMAWLAIVARPPTPDRPERHTADVQTVYVAPEARGRGIAQRLVAALLEVAVEAGVERTTVHSSVVGEALYRRLGFGDAARLLQLPPED
jgi:ribosomal protein S18 acetylase RimI-like enzyme